MQDDLARAEAGLRSRREPYARVTVVWSASPVSARPGDAALITGDGRLQGWIGGSCAQPIVIRQALACLAEGAPTLLHLAPPGQLPLGRVGLVVAPVTCASEGSLEVFIEPRLPSPHLVVIGSAPLVGALGVMARAVDFEVTVVERDWAKDADLGGPGLGHSHGAGWPGLTGTDEGAFGGASTIGELDLAKAGVGPETFVVVATMGRYDEDAVEAALDSGAGYVALVASDRRAARVRELLAQGGVSQADLARVRAPAGLALGDLPHTEIAVAILAEVVAEKAKRRAGAAVPAGAPVRAGAAVPAGAPVPAGAAVPPASAAVDPVCGMTVEVAGAQDRAEHGGATWWFCSSGCRRRFQANPDRFLETAEGRAVDMGSA
ncbi:MAG: xanthine dehydrogenase [Acidimicrobiales bacterium]|nr:MAG: xanthine dehydrogenase [Acidimicrobiales bacterium]